MHCSWDASACPGPKAVPWIDASFNLVLRAVARTVGDGAHRTVRHCAYPPTAHGPVPPNVWIIGRLRAGNHLAPPHPHTMIPVTSVLIVDDERGVRDLMSRWVSALGLDVRVASNAEQALEQLNERHSDLAVIDIMMPGKTGLWLAGELRRDHPHTAVVLATGYTQLLDGAKEEPVADLLIKPFKRER